MIQVSSLSQNRINDGLKRLLKTGVQTSVFLISTKKHCVIRIFWYYKIAGGCSVGGHLTALTVVQEYDNSPIQSGWRAPNILNKALQYCIAVKTPTT